MTGLFFGWTEVVAGLEGAAVVAAVDRLGGGDLEVVRPFQNRSSLMVSVMWSPVTDLARALSNNDPTAPVEGSIPVMVK